MEIGMEAKTTNFYKDYKSTSRECQKYRLTKLYNFWHPMGLVANIFQISSGFVFTFVFKFPTLS